MRWKVGLLLVITLASLVWVLWGLPFDSVKASLGAFRWADMLLVFGFYALTHGLRVLRLRWILGRHVPFWRLMSIVSIGYVAINVVPLRMGEFVRPAMLSEREGIPFGAGMAAVFVERLVDMLMLLGMLWIVAFGVDLPAAVVVKGVDLLAFGQRFAGTIVVGGTVGLAVMVAMGERALAQTDRLPFGLGRLVRRFVEGIRGLWQRPAALAMILSSSVVIWLVTLWSVQVSLAAFPGMPHDLTTSLVVWTMTLLGMAAVPTPGFFGGFEAACIAGLTLLGVESDSARTFAVLLHIGQFGFTVAWGLVFLVWEGVSLRDVVGRSQRAFEQERGGGTDSSGT